MTTPIHDAVELEQRLARHITDTTQIRHVRELWHDLTSHIPRHDYHPDSTTPTKETPVSLTTFAAGIREDLSSLLTNAEGDATRVKTAIEQKLPEIERIGTMFDNDPLVQLAIGEVVPAPLRQLAADAVNTLVKAFTAAPAAAPAEPEAPAGPAAEDPQPAPVAAGPVVAGTAG